MAQTKANEYDNILDADFADAPISGNSISADIATGSINGFTSSLNDEQQTSLDPQQTFHEGSINELVLSIHERSAAARRACIRHYGARCVVCGFDFGQTYGELGRGFIHVHHLDQLAEKEGEYEIDAVSALRPVCPNCHEMIHKRYPCYSIEELCTVIRNAKSQREEEVESLRPSHLS